MTGPLNIYPLDLRPVDEIVSFTWHDSYAGAGVDDQCWWCEGFYGGGSPHPILSWVDESGEQGVMHPSCLPDMRARRVKEADRAEAVSRLADMEEAVKAWQGHEDALIAANDAWDEGREPMPSHDLAYARDDAAVDIVRDLAGFLALVRKGLVS